jgi:hypothetical protein
LAAPPPPRLPIDISKARRTSSPGGLCFCAAPKAFVHSAFTFVAMRTVFRQNFAEIFT